MKCDGGGGGLFLSLPLEGSVSLELCAFHPPPVAVDSMEYGEEAERKKKRWSLWQQSWKSVKLPCAEKKKSQYCNPDNF